MRVTVRVFGREVLTVDITPDDECPDDGPAAEVTFGFHGGAGGQVERADPWPLSEV